MNVRLEVRELLDWRAVPYSYGVENPPLGTLGIQKSGPPPMRRRRRWPLVALVLLGVLCAVAVAVLLGGAWYIEKTAREKLQKYADRAGVTLEVGALILEPGSLAELRGVTVSDPHDGDALMFSATHIITDLSFDDLKAGQRMPTEVVLVGLEADLSEPKRFSDALERFRSSGKQDASSQKKRALPRVRFEGATLTVPDPMGGDRIRLEDVDAQLKRDASSGDERWQIALEARLGGSQQRFRTDVRLDPKNGDHELGVTFEPPFRVPGLTGIELTVGSVFASARTGVRAYDVTVRHANGAHGTVRSVTVALDDVRPRGTGAVEAVLRDVEGEAFGATGSGRSIRVSLAAGPLSEALNRVRRVVVDDVSLDAPSLLAAVDSTSLTLAFNGIDREAPLARLQSVELLEADVGVVLPPPSEARKVPYYREIQAFLLGQSMHAGGGPSEPSAPAATQPTAKQALPTARIRNRLKALLGAARPTISVVDGSLALMIPGDEEPAIFVQGLNANLKPGAAGGTLEGAVSGQLEQTATGEKGRFHVSAKASEGGAIETVHVSLSGSKLAHQIARLSPSIRLMRQSSLSINVDITPHATGSGLTVAGKVGLTDMGFFAPRIHGTPVDGLRVEADLHLDVFPDQDRLTLDAPRVQIGGGAIVRLAAEIERLDGRRPKLDIKLNLPEQDCNTALRSIPSVMVPRLKSLVLTGKMSGHLNVSVDLLDPDTYKQDLDVNMQKCRPVQFGEADVGRLKGRFVHQPVVKGEPLGVTVGPGTWHYRPLERIPRHIRMGALWTEDHSFFKHQGFRPGLIARAVRMNIKGGRYVYGGSTITQQLVKNLFLSREKTLTRKLEEAIVVWLVERTLSKNRILELYLNCIEYGPKIWGIENAAQAYFGKHVEELDALEGAFLMGLKPYPWSGWKQYQRGYVKPWWHKRLGKILRGMAKRGWISEEELEASRPFDPVFKTSSHSRRRPVPKPVEPTAEEEDAPPETPNEQGMDDE